MKGQLKKAGKTVTRKMQITTQGMPPYNAPADWLKWK